MLVLLHAICTAENVTITLLFFGSSPSDNEHWHRLPTYSPRHTRHPSWLPLPDTICRSSFYTRMVLRCHPGRHPFLQRLDQHTAYSHGFFLHKLFCTNCRVRWERSPKPKQIKWEIRKYIKRLRCKESRSSARVISQTESPLFVIFLEHA